MLEDCRRISEAERHDRILEVPICGAKRYREDSRVRVLLERPPGSWTREDVAKLPERGRCQFRSRRNIVALEKEKIEHLRQDKEEDKEEKYIDDNGDGDITC